MPRECQSAMLSMRGTLGRMRRAIAVGLDRSIMQELCYARGMPKSNRRRARMDMRCKLEQRKEAKKV